MRFLMNISVRTIKQVNLMNNTQDNKQALTTEQKRALLQQKLRAEVETKKQQANTGKEQLAYISEALPTVEADPEGRFLPFPLTEIQQAYMLGRQSSFDFGGFACHWYHEIDCPYDEAQFAAFNQVCRQLIDRHDMLRVVMLPDGQQRVLSPQEIPPYTIEVTDLSAQPEAAKASQLAELREQMSHQVIDAYTWPIFDIKAVRTGSQSVRLFVSVDMLVVDGYSGFLLYKELYQMMNQPEVALPPLPLNFRDYVLATDKIQETAYYKKSCDYWFDRIDNLPPSAELPLVPAVDEDTQVRFSRRHDTIPADVWGKLKARGAKLGLTPSSILTAVFAEILSIWSKSSHFILNVTQFDRLHPQVNDIVGDFTSPMLVEIDNTTTESFERRAVRIQRQLWEDLSHNAISAVGVLREMTRRRKGAYVTMPIVFTSTLWSGSEQESFAGDMSPKGWLGDSVYGITQTPQVLFDHQLAEIKGELIVSWDCVEERFPAGLLESMFNAYCDMLTLLATDETAWQKASFQDELLATQLMHRALINDTAQTPSEALLHELFIAKAIKNPDAIAVISASRTLTYGELLDLAKRTANWLQQQGAEPNTLVAVAMEKGWEQIVAVLGVLMSGAAYLPVDANQPDARRHAILADGQVSLVLTQPQFETLAWPADSLQLIITDENLAQQNTEVADVSISAEDLAYVLYTSGSTGKPKGTMLPHRGPVNTILDVNRKLGVTEKDRAICLSALNFDLSVYDVFGLLSAGGALVIPEHGGLRDPAHWRELINTHQVTLWNTVPALQQMLVDYLESSGGDLASSMRLVMMSGDWIPVDLPDRIRQLSSDVMIVGLGGPTETSIWNNHYVIEEVDPSWTSIPYGKPLANQTLHVLNDKLEPRPVWVTGDLYVGGRGLGKGYWGDAQKTNETFITHPQTGERLYKSGDLARYLPDGNLEIMGRSDFQVKIRGHRIELNEIESVISEYPGIRDAVVTAVGGERNLQSLAAFVVPEGTGQPTGDGEQAEQEEVILDQFAGLEFKLTQPGVRKVEDGMVEIPIAAPEVVESAWLTRQSYREFRQDPLAQEHLGQLLSHLSAVTLEETPLPKYRYPSAGSLYPVQCYVYVKPNRVAGLEGGVYYHHPVRNSLLQMAKTNDIGEQVFAGNIDIYEEAAFAIFLISDLSAIEPLYAHYSERFSLLEAGHIGQMLMESSTRHGIGLCPIGKQDLSAVEALFGLGERHLPLYTFLGGGIDPEQTRKLSRPVSKTASLADKLKDFVSARLPDYMVPSTFELLEALPLTANGKVDRKALHAQIDNQEIEKPEFVAPDSALEKSIAQIWAALLGHDNIGIHDNFFEAGGDSMLIVRMQSKLREIYHQEIPVTKLFQHSTIDALARYLGQEEKVEEAIASKADKRQDRRGSTQRRKQARKKHRSNPQEGS
ncbi:hypothetical protein N476_05800 [Pseudoalteromonas luteoviolacea H33]|uniref:L-cysteine--[L-cysteinyl-carrier protein] ligase n=2 Tax=Pseudoalteromonas luteoviolacea TaxID=43657 RepID=A0A166ZNU2_9GAMM|nr:hypothetical protein N476_05800 [Pseudoalteromonas luteoviolacea H33]KZN78527.1 hypothetical protein N477_08990 [Pseudoalteromonas luteoviolacea H33-S]